MRTHILTAALLCASTSVHAGTVNVVKNFGEFTASGSLDVEERILPVDSGNDFFFGDQGVYNVSNNTGGNLMGFGVSNNFTLPVLYNDAGRPAPFGCTDAPGYQICYETRELNAGNWNEEIAFTEFVELMPVPDLVAFANVESMQLIDYPYEVSVIEHTFQDIFGTFESVAGEDQMFNWFDFTSDVEVFNPRPVEKLEITAVDVIDTTMEMYAVEEQFLASPLANGDSVDDFFGFLAGLERSAIIGHSANQNGNSFYTAGQAVPPAVPLPAAAWMLMAGIGGLGAMARRKKA